MKRSKSTILFFNVGVIAGLSLVVVLFGNACSGGFKAQESLELVQASNLVPSPQQLATGTALYEKNCSGCHGRLEESNKSGKSPHTIQQAIQGLSFMQHLKVLEGPQIEAIAAALGYRDQAQACLTQKAADQTAMFRLNKTEYMNTISDLFGVQATGAENFPIDNDGVRFANDAPSLASVSPELLEQYLLSAEKIVSQVMTTNKALIMTCSPTSSTAVTCATNILSGWGLKVLRRPLQTAELTQLLGMVPTTASVSVAQFEAGIQTAIQSLLVSPHFIYRVVVKGSGSVKELDSYEFATRLSYFLWSSTPDAELLETAKAGTIKQDQVLKAQINRMLTSPKIKRMGQNFARRWFGLQHLGVRQPSTTLFPNFKPSLKSAMEQETILLFENMVSQNRSLNELVTADYSFLNQELASHYGVSGITGTQFRMVSMAQTARRGVVSHAGVLMLTSSPDDSSVIKRGKWVLETLMCDPPPAPPDNVNSELPPGSENLTKRQALAAHRNNPACFSCHAKMDPIGFGLENYDALGAYRTMLGNAPVDNAGSLPDGKPFSGAVELSDFLVKDASYAQCASKQLMSYALGRVMTKEDDCNVKSVSDQTVKANRTFAETIEAVIRNDLFRKVEFK